jgi:hypothetical protein
MTPEDLEQILFDDAPQELFERLLRGTFAAHKIAYEDTYGTHADTEAENALPYNRRAHLEGAMRDAAAMVPGVSSRVVRSSRSSWNHTELRSGRVVITASTVQSPCGLVEPSEFRTTLARSSQGVLWPEPGDVPGDTTPLYALFLHGRSVWARREDKEKYGKLLGSAYIALPAPDLRSYVHEINLFDLFPDVVADNFPREWDEEAKVSYLAQSRRILAS